MTSPTTVSHVAGEEILSWAAKDESGHLAPLKISRRLRIFFNCTNFLFQVPNFSIPKSFAESKTATHFPSRIHPSFCSPICYNHKRSIWIVDITIVSNGVQISLTFFNYLAFIQFLILNPQQDTFDSWVEQFSTTLVWFLSSVLNKIQLILELNNSQQH